MSHTRMSPAVGAGARAGRMDLDGMFRRRLLAVAAVLMAAWSHPVQAQDMIVVGKTFLASALDPARGNAGWALTSHGIGQNLFTVSRDGRVVPSLARDASSIDERSWTVRLKPDQRFSDGTAVTAADVATGLNRTVAENPAARSAGTLSFEALDALTLKVTGERPLPILPSTLAEWPFVVYRAGERGPVFTGPWQVAAFEPDRELRLEPNRFYPDADQRPRIRLRRFGDGQALALAVQSGEVDLAFNVPVEALPRLRASAGVTVKSFPVAYQYMAWINTARPALGDVRVRRAIDLAIDRDLLMQAINGGARATGAYATTFPFATREPRPFDRARAAALLDEAGWRLDGNVRRKDGQTLRLVLLAYPQRPDLVTMQPVLRSEFAKLGIEVETRVSDNAQAAAREGNFDLMLWAQHTAPAGDPAFFPNLFLRSGAANNHARFSSPDLDAVLDRLATTSDVEARMMIAGEAERIVFAQAPVAYLLTPVWHVALSRRIASYEPWGSDYYVLGADLRSSR
jgi:peptide/nickel transport system substrate-binding protein